MKKLIATALFFASFSVAMAQTHPITWSQILFSYGIHNYASNQSSPATVRSETSSSAKQCNLDDIPFCNAQADGDGNGSNTCSGIWRRDPIGNGRCWGVRRGHDNYDKNPCRPLGCSKDVLEPKPKPLPANCRQIQEAIDAVKKRIANLPNNDRFRGLREELRNLLNSLEKRLKDCQGNNRGVACGYDNNQQQKYCSSNEQCCTGIRYVRPTCISKDLICGKCLSFSSKIATPRGNINVTDLKVGDMVWTTDIAGNRIVRSLIKVSHVSAVNHRVVHLILTDGRTLDVSAAHPTANGRMVGDLIVGDTYNGSTVKSVILKPYEGTATYDILPSGDTGFYFANGILMGSTLK